MAAYEEWFARQPKPPREAPASLARRRPRPWSSTSPGTTRPGSRASTCPTGARRCPDASSSAARRQPATRPAAPQRRTVDTAAPIATPLAALRARVARLLDRSAARQPDELDLAEAVCAAALAELGRPIAARSTSSCCAARSTAAPSTAQTLTWLDSHEFAEPCREGDVVKPRTRIGPFHAGRTAYLPRRGPPDTPARRGCHGIRAPGSALRLRGAGPVHVGQDPAPAPRQASSGLRHQPEQPDRGHRVRGQVARGHRHRLATATRPSRASSTMPASTGTTTCSGGS